MYIVKDMNEINATFVVQQLKKSSNYKKKIQMISRLNLNNYKKNSSKDTRYSISINKLNNF